MVYRVAECTRARRIISFRFRRHKHPSHASESATCFVAGVGGGGDTTCLEEERGPRTEGELPGWERFGGGKISTPFYCAA